jgi:enoyl-CoA hydratase/carnithine racemase
VTDVRVEVTGQVMQVTLDGPDSLNSLTPGVLDDLDAALDAAEGSTSLRALVVRGVGKAFCVGMDIDFLGECFADPFGVFLPFIRRYHEVLDRLEALPVPSIAAVNGLARAGGFELLLACDFVIAADEARVADTHREFGVVPGAGAAVRAARKLGDQKARALLLAGRWLGGAEMTQWGLALSNVPLGELDEEVQRLTGQLCGRSRPVTAAVKQVLNAAPDLPLGEALRLERELFARFMESAPDAAEGYRAFVEKRAPHWGDA